MIKKYFKHFKYLFIALGFILAIYLVLLLIRNLNSSQNAERMNTETTTQERVFDYADKLTNQEEEKLRTLIAKRQKQTGCDIVLVTLDESLKEYAKGYEASLGYLEVNEYVCVYADNFYDEHKFGFDKAYGDGVVYVDNWGQEEDGYRYTWLSTSGKAQEKYTDARINNLIDKVIDQTNENPYQAYETYINQVYDDMTGKISFHYDMPMIVMLVLTLIVTATYSSVQLAGNKNLKTTKADSYIATDHLQFDKKEDAFLNKMVTSRRIPRNTTSSSGGGGGHMSAGGHSHGGGGGRH